MRRSPAWSPALMIKSSGSSNESQLGFGRSDQQVVHEQGVVGAGADRPHLDSVGWVPACIAVDHVQCRPRVQVIERQPPAGEETLSFRRDVHTSPPNMRRAVGPGHDALVFGAAAGLFAREHRERAVGQNGGAFASQRVLVQPRRRRVVENFGRVKLGPARQIGRGQGRRSRSSLQCRFQNAALFPHEGSGQGGDDTPRPWSQAEAATGRDRNLVQRSKGTTMQYSRFRPRARTRVVAAGARCGPSDERNAPRVASPQQCSDRARHVVSRDGERGV